MRVVLVVSAVLLAGVWAAAPSWAQESTGLYSPFPSPTGVGRIQRYVGELGLTLDRERVIAGTRVTSRLPPRPGAASVRARAGLRDDHPAGGLLVGAIVAAVLGAAAVVATGRAGARSA